MLPDVDPELAVVKVKSYHNWSNYRYREAQRWKRKQKVPCIKAGIMNSS